MKSGSARRTWFISGACLLLIAGAGLILHRFQSNHRLGDPGVRVVHIGLSDDTGEPATERSIYLPATVADYTSVPEPVTRLELEWLPADTTFGRRRYKGPDGFEIFVSGVLMGTDRTSIHKPEYCLPGQGFQITTRSQREIRIDRPHEYALPVTRLDALREVTDTSGVTHRIGAVYVYWFVSDSRLSNDHLQRMWWLAFDLVRTGELQRWSYMGCLAVCPPGSEDATYARLETFIRELVPEFQITTGPSVSAAPEPSSHPGAATPALNSPGVSG